MLRPQNTILLTIVRNVKIRTNKRSKIHNLHERFTFINTFNKNIFMRTGLITLTLLLLFIMGFSQNTFDNKTCKRVQPVKNEKIQEARLMSEIMSDYPKDFYNTLIDYVSIDISASCNGKAMLSHNTSDTLSTEQKNILNTADLGTDIALFIKFKYKDPANDNLGTGGKIKEMSFVTMVVPEIEAQYPGGIDQAKAYLKDYVIAKIKDENATEKIMLADLVFLVNEEGKATEVKLLRSSTDTKIDQLLLEAVNNMPKWKPGANAKGMNVKQVIVITLGTRRC